jgi:hypothetical protein
MAVVKQTYTRTSTDVEWYTPSEPEKTYIGQTYPGLEYGFDKDGDLIFIKTRTGSIEDCQRFYNELQDPTSTVFQARRKYQDDNGITYTIELIE